MKLPQTITDRLQHWRAKDSTTANEPDARRGLRRLSAPHKAFGRLPTPHKAFGGAALAAAIAAVGFLAFPTASQSAGAATANMGTAPQLHVAGNQLVSASGQRIQLHGVDRSGTEFMCVQNHGIFDGPNSAASVKVMKATGINAVRVPLNEACWNGDSYVKHAYSGAHYRAAIKAYVQALNAQGMAVVLDLHWTNGAYTGPASACSTSQATCQKPMPDKAGAIPFWTSVASTFKNNDSVIFDLFNEPYPEQAAQNNPAEGWQCWLHGGHCVGIPYPVAGMQSMVNAVRATGANNVMMLGGLEWSNALSQWLAHKPADPDHNLVASWHSYNFNACSTKSCWNSQIAPLLAKVPLVAGEIGENDCADHYVSPLTGWLNSKGASYLAWTWNSDFNCATGPGLITSYDGHPTKFGVGYEAMLHSMAQQR
jgi:endoglucanase